MKHPLHKTILILFFIIFVGCTNTDNVPSDILAQERMIDILSDVHLVESMSRHNQLKDNNQRANMYYNYILAKHGITLAELDSSIAWYAKHPTAYLPVYDKVIQQLEKKLETVRLSTETLFETSTFSIWEKTSEMQINSLDNTNIPFKIETNRNITLSAGDQFELKAKFAVKNLPANINLFMRVKVHYTDNTESIFEKKVVTTSASLLQTLIFQGNPNKEIDFISGDLCAMPNAIDKAINVDIKIVNIELLQHTKLLN